MILLGVFMSNTIADLVTQQIIDIQFDSLEKLDVKKIHHLMLDYLAVTIAGAKAGALVPVVQFAKNSSAAGCSIAFGYEQPLQPEWAGYINAIAAHILDYDDMYYDGFIHPGAMVFSTAFVVAQEQQSSYQDFIEAIAVGYEVGIMLSRAQAAEGMAKTFTRGINVTSSIGTIMAAAVSAKLKKFSYKQTQQAVCLAATLATGFIHGVHAINAMSLMYCFGWAVHSGILAARAAQCGMAIDPAIFEDDQGYFNAFSSNAKQSIAMFKQSNSLHLNKISIKRFSCVGNIQPAMNIAYDLWHENQFKLENIDSITVKVNHATYIECCIPEQDKKNPASENQGMLSLPFSLALMLKNGYLSTDMYSTDYIPPTPDLVSLMSLMHFVDDKELTDHPDYQNDFPASITINLKDGTVLEGFRHYHDGDYRAAMSEKALQQKFSETNKFGHDDASIKRLLIQISQLPNKNMAHFCQELNQVLIGEK
jgi:2-methylcitrate dehydratase PrpD